MMRDWLKKSCEKCGDTVRFLEHWTVVPKHCAKCRVKAIENLAHCLKHFLRHEESIAKRVHTLEEKAAYAERQNLREKVSTALKKSRADPETLSRVCCGDLDLAKLALQMYKQLKLGINSSDRSKMVPKHIHPFLQGGAPGLGKRS